MCIEDTECYSPECSAPRLTYRRDDGSVIARDTYCPFHSGLDVPYVAGLHDTADDRDDVIAGWPADVW